VEQRDTRQSNQATPMKSVWLIVLLSMLLTTVGFGGYQWLRYTKARAEHRRAIEKLVTLQGELSAYIAYLQEHGTSSPERYFQ